MRTGMPRIAIGKDNNAARAIAISSRQQFGDSVAFGCVVAVVRVGLMESDGWQGLRLCEGPDGNPRDQTCRFRFHLVPKLRLGNASPRSSASPGGGGLSLQHLAGVPRKQEPQLVPARGRRLARSEAELRGYAVPSRSLGPRLKDRSTRRLHRRGEEAARRAA